VTLAIFCAVDLLWGVDFILESDRDESRRLLPDAFNQEQRRQGAAVLHFIGLFYMFVALAIVCDEFFVPSLEVISDSLNLSPDVAGATFMAAGGSAPEFFTSMIGAVVLDSDIGIGTIVGSAVFNVLFVIGACALVAPTALQLTWFPLARDSLFYIVDLVVVTLTFSDGQVKWSEAVLLFGLYLVYALFMKHSSRIETRVLLWLDARHSRGEDEASEPGYWASKRASTVDDLAITSAAAQDTELVVQPAGDEHVIAATGETNSNEDINCTLSTTSADASPIKPRAGKDDEETETGLRCAGGAEERQKSLTTASSVPSVKTRRSTISIDGSSHSAGENLRGAFRHKSMRNTIGAERMKLAIEEADTVDAGDAHSPSTRKSRTSRRSMSLSGIGEVRPWMQGQDPRDLSVITELKDRGGPEEKPSCGSSPSSRADSTGGSGSVRLQKDACRQGDSAESARPPPLLLPGEAPATPQQPAPHLGMLSGRCNRDREGESKDCPTPKNLSVLPDAGPGPPVCAISSCRSAPPPVSAAIVPMSDEDESGTPKGPLKGPAKDTAKVEDDEEEEEENNPLDLTPPDRDAGLKDWLWYLGTLPICLCLIVSVPDVRREGFRKYYILAFFMSILWIAVFTYFMVQFASIIAETCGMPDEVMGLTVLAAGTSVPDLLTSVIVARQGHGDMAISSSIGSNIFDVTVGLPIPWLVYGLIHWRPVSISNKGLESSVLLLILMLVFTIGTIICNRWVMTRLMGMAMMGLYLVFEVTSVIMATSDAAVSLPR